MQSACYLLILGIIFKQINMVSKVTDHSCLFKLLHWDKDQHIYMAKYAINSCVVDN